MTILFALLFFVIGIGYKSISEEVVRKSEIKTESRISDGVLDSIDIWITKQGDKLYHIVYPLPIGVMIFWIIILSIFCVTVLDLVGGVGRESPLFKKKKIESCEK